MIKAVGVDTVEPKRFEHWHTYSCKKLKRIFSDDEISYCLQNRQKSSERFAVRFACKEAFFKALCVAYPDIYIPFLTMCRHISVSKKQAYPVLLVDWHSLIAEKKERSVHISLSHSTINAVAFVVLEEKGE